MVLPSGHVQRLAVDDVECADGDVALCTGRWIRRNAHPGHTVWVGLETRNMNGRPRKRSISADTALRLSRYFGLSERLWLNLQARYDLEVEKDRLEGRLENEVKVLAVNQMAHARA